MPWTYLLIEIVAIIFIVGTLLQLTYIIFKRSRIRTLLGSSYSRIPEAKRLSVWQIGGVIFWLLLGIAIVLQVLVTPGVPTKGSFFPYYFLIIFSFSFVLIIIFKHNGFGGKRVIFYNESGFLVIPEIRARLNWFKINFIAWEEIKYAKIRRKEKYHGFWLINIELENGEIEHLFMMEPEKETFKHLLNDNQVRFESIR